MQFLIKEPKVLLINPKMVRFMGEFTLPPMGLTLVSAVLKQNNYFVKGLNLDYETKPLYENLKEHIDKYKINIVGIGSLSYGYNEVQEILNIIKSLDTNIVTILGGGIIKEDTQLIFDSFDNLDIGVIGEGEVTIVELMKAFENGNKLNMVDGIIYKKNNSSVITAPREFIKNLDELPYPDFDEFNIEAFFNLQFVNSNYQLYKRDNPRILTLFSSRSCPYGCTFCAHIIGRKYRAFSLDYFFNLLEYMIEKYQINMLQVLDELFSVNKARLNEFCERIKKYNLVWWAQTRVDVITKDDLIMMKDAGCYFVSYGLEHVNDDILKSMKKKITRKQIERTLAITYELNIGIQGNIIIGDPLETEETFQEAVNWVIKNKKYQPNMYPIITYPGTNIFKQAVERGLIKDKIEFIKSKTMFINLTQMSEDSYYNIVKYASDVSQYISVYGDVKKVQRSFFHQYLGFMYDLKVVCGHCMEELIYKNFHINADLENWNSIKICCRKCNGKFDISKNSLQKHMIEEYDIKSLVSINQEIYMIIDTEDKIAISYMKNLFKEYDDLNISKVLNLKNIEITEDNASEVFEKEWTLNKNEVANKNILFMFTFLEQKRLIYELEKYLLQFVNPSRILNLNKWVIKYKKR